MISSRCLPPCPRRYAPGVLLSVLLSGCLLAAVPAALRAQGFTPRPVISAFTPPPTPAVQAPPAAPAPAAPAVAAGGVSASYTLSVNDTVEVAVYQEDDLRTVTAVSQEGTISFPLIGVVKVGGMTPTQARDRIAELLRARFLVNPQVSLTVVRFASKRFSIIGQVNRPSTYELPAQENIDLLEAIAMAGGFTRIANGSKVTIRRKTGEDEKIFTINADKMAKDTSVKRFMISPGDEIRVGESIF